MPKKITNPIRAGLPSKIYLLAYNGPKSGYEIASKIYKREKYPPTSKIYSWTKKMEGKELSKTEKGYISKIDPLLNEIEITLKNYDIELSDFDKHVLFKILDSPEFRSYVEDANCNIPLDQDFDSAWVIMSTLGMLTTGTLMALRSARHMGKKPVPIKEAKIVGEFNELWSEIKSKKGEAIAVKKRIQKEIIPDLKKYLESLKDMMPLEAKSVEKRMEGIYQDPTKFAFFAIVPEDLLLKLSRLSPLGELFPSLILNVLSWKKLEKLLKGEKWFADNP